MKILMVAMLLIAMILGAVASFARSDPDERSKMGALGMVFMGMIIVLLRMMVDALFPRK